jgi:hypothetical protein
MLRPHLILRLVLLAFIAALSACGGGGDSTAGGVGSGGTGASVGTVQVSMTDAPSPDFDRVWITVRKIRFHTSATASPDDAGWQDFVLPAPVTLDLAALNNGALSTVFSNVSLPPGIYRQIRLVLAGEDEPLTSSAQAQSLLFNDQIDYTVSGTSHSAALEIANPVQGITISGPFAVLTGQTLRLAFDFNLGSDVVRFLRNGVTAFTLKPRLQAFDLDHAGAITGQIDPATLTSAGAFNVVVKVERPDASATLHAAVRATSIRADGSFTLYPVAVPPGQSTVSVDVLVRGRNMATMIMKNVIVTRGSTPDHNPVQLTQSAISVDASTEYTANTAAGDLKPTGSWVTFYQTLPGSGELPYEVNFRHANPFTGNFSDDINLARAALRLATYNNGADVSFTAVTPLEGDGGFQAMAAAPGFANTPADANVTPPASGSGPVAISFASPLSPAAGVTVSTISGSITQQTAGKYDNGYLVISRDGLIATTLDIGNTLAQGGGVGGAYTVANLAGGSAATPLPGAFYYGYVIVWNSAHPLLSLRLVPVAARADLRQGSATGFDLDLN